MAYWQIMAIIERLKFNPSLLQGITAILTLISPSEQSGHEICHANHVTGNERREKNAYQCARFNKRRGGLATPCA
jgi:hypothetical protein